MKRYILILLPLLALNFTVSAQDTHRTWDQGPLTWDDFTILTTGGAEQSFLQYELGFAPAHDTIDGIQSHYYLATACISTLPTTQRLSTICSTQPVTDSTPA